MKHRKRHHRNKRKTHNPPLRCDTNFKVTEPEPKPEVFRNSPTIKPTEPKPDPDVTPSVETVPMKPNMYRIGDILRLYGRSPSGASSWATRLEDYGSKPVMLKVPGGGKASWYVDESGKADLCLLLENCRVPSRRTRKQPKNNAEPCAPITPLLPHSETQAQTQPPTVSQAATPVSTRTLLLQQVELIRQFDALVKQLREVGIDPSDLLRDSAS